MLSISTTIARAPTIEGVFSLVFWLHVKLTSSSNAYCSRTMGLTKEWHVDCMERIEESSHMSAPHIYPTCKP